MNDSEWWIKMVIKEWERFDEEASFPGSPGEWSVQKKILLKHIKYMDELTLIYNKKKPKIKKKEAKNGFITDEEFLESVVGIGNKGEWKQSIGPALALLSVPALIGWVSWIIYTLDKVKR